MELMTYKHPIYFPLLFNKLLSFFLAFIKYYKAYIACSCLISILYFYLLLIKNDKYVLYYLFYENARGASLSRAILSYYPLRVVVEYDRGTFWAHFCSLYGKG